MQRPNILIIYTDQQRWDAMGINGNPDIKTPNLDKLAQEGVNFDHYFIQNPVCMPSRVSFLTGQYPSKLGITQMGVPVPEETITLPKMLGNYGYRSANIGKLHFLPHANRDHRNLHPDYGFDHLEISDEPGSYEDAYRAWVRRKAPEELDKVSLGQAPLRITWMEAMGLTDDIKHPLERFPKKPLAFNSRDDLTHTAFVAEQSIAFMKQQNEQGQPFLCVAGIYSPHSPWVAPQRFIDMYDPDTLTLPEFPPEIEAKRKAGHYDDHELRLARQGYYAMISEVDYHVGQMMTALDDLGIRDNTIVVFTSDHGEWLGEHLKYGKGYPGPDVVSRVPLIIRGPAELGIKATGESLNHIAEGVDVIPTLLDLTGIQQPPQLQGRSLLSSLGGRGYAGRGSALMEFTGWKMLRSERYRYLCHADGSEKLWDLVADPSEYHDIAAEADSAEILAQHRHLLVQRLIEMERPLERTWGY